MERSLAHYQVLEQLGVGAMGTVFRARDTKLGRDVAIKLLGPEAAPDPVARERLVREAQLASALNHPHICTVYEVGEAGDLTYIAMELVRGPALSQQIPPTGLPFDTVLRYGIQIADALSHAHEHGIVHRDLKSSNVVIGANGQAKVLDFGVARRSHQSEGSPHDFTLTETGALVGTPAYLAPELLRGERADAKSDIWSLGVLLQEMATGRPPFQRRTPYELSAAILNEPPEPLPERLSAGFRAVVQGCLRKDPGDRTKRASDVRAALEMLQSDHRAAPERARSRAVRWPQRVALAALALALVSAALWFFVAKSSHRPELSQRQVTSNTPDDPVVGGDLSPDGKSLAFFSEGLGLQLRDLDSGDSRSVSLPPGFSFASATYPVVGIDWFPDGRHLLVSGTMANGSEALWEIPVIGGRARKLQSEGSGAQVSPDGTRIAYFKAAAAGPELWCARSDGTDARRVVSSDSSGILSGLPAWSPHGERIEYDRVAYGPRGGQTRLESCDLSGSRRVAFQDTPEQQLHPLTVAAWLPDHRMVFGLRDPSPGGDVNLWWLPVDPRSGEPSGVPRRITQWTRMSYLRAMASADGRRLGVNAVGYQSDIYVGRSDGGGPLRDVHRFTQDNRFDLFPAWAPDGESMFFSADRNGTMDIFHQRLDTTEAEPVAVGPDEQTSPKVSPDGRWLLYRDSRSAQKRDGGTTEGARLMRMPIDGGPPETVCDVWRDAGFRCARAPATRCVMAEAANGHFVFTGFDPLAGRGAELARVTAPVIVVPWDLAPDGGAIAYVSGDGSPTRIEVITLRDRSRREVRLDQDISTAYLAWTPEGSGWYIVGLAAGRTFKPGWRLIRIAPDGRTTDLIPPQQWMYGMAPSPDGKTIAFTSNTVEGNVWLLEGF